jgi:hypothetical protein
MQLSTAIATMAIVLGAIVVAPAIPQTQQEKVEAREAARRAAIEEQQKRKVAFQRACSKARTEAELETCRAAYKRLDSEK